MDKQDFVAKVTKTKGDIFDQKKGSLFRAGHPEGAFKNKPPASAGNGICNKLLWLNDNYGNVILTFELSWSGPLAGYKVYDADGALIHEEKPVPIKGEVTQTNPVAAIEEIGRRALDNLIEQIANEKGLL